MYWASSTINNLDKDEAEEIAGRIGPCVIREDETGFYIVKLMTEPGTPKQKPFDLQPGERVWGREA